MQQPKLLLHKQSLTTYQKLWLIFLAFPFWIGIPQSLLVYLFYIWFVKPLGFPIIGYWQMLGLLAFVRIIRYQPLRKLEPDDPDENDVDFKEGIELYERNYFSLICQFLFGWAVHMLIKGHL